MFMLTLPITRSRLSVDTEANTDCDVSACMAGPPRNPIVSQNARWRFPPSPRFQLLRSCAFALYSSPYASKVGSAFDTVNTSALACQFSKYSDGASSRYWPHTYGM